MDAKVTQRADTGSTWLGIRENVRDVKPWLNLQSLRGGMGEENPGERISLGKGTGVNMVSSMKFIYLTNMY